MKIYQAIIIALYAIFVFGCSQTQPQSQAKSPIEVLRTLSEASKTKDVAAIKNSVSRGTLNLIEETAKVQNTTVDELLKKENGAPFKELPEMRGEKIDGETATVELKNTTSNGWEIVPFVKEEGIWKLAMDKYLEDFKRKATESMKTLPSENDSASQADKSSKEAENKRAKSKK